MTKERAFEEEKYYTCLSDYQCNMREVDRGDQRIGYSSNGISSKKRWRTFTCGSVKFLECLNLF